MIFVHILLLIALLRLLIETENPLLCASILGGGVLIAALLFGAAFFPALLEAAISFADAWIWFWLLDRFARTGLWWAILVAGLLAPGLVRFALSSARDRDGDSGSPSDRIEAPGE